jgi:hypothetical protein
MYLCFGGGVNADDSISGSVGVNLTADTALMLYVQPGSFHRSRFFMQSIHPNNASSPGLGR